MTPFLNDEKYCSKILKYMLISQKLVLLQNRLVDNYS